jgi:hypothetical protein
MTNTTQRLVKVSHKTLIHGMHFNLGYRQALAKLPYAPDYERWPKTDQWEYERGRQYAALTNGQISPKIGKKVNPMAIKMLTLAAHHKLIL